MVELRCYHPGAPSLVVMLSNAFCLSENLAVQHKASALVFSKQKALLIYLPRLRNQRNLFVLCAAVRYSCPGKQAGKNAKSPLLSCKLA